MPYVSGARRLYLDSRVKPPKTGTDSMGSSGELNYLVCRLVEMYRAEHGDRYQTFNDIVGALDNAKDEFKRRIQDPYEDDKIDENGDVFAPPGTY